MKILGIDPGSAVAGFACIEVPDHQWLQINRYRVVDLGVVRFDKRLEHARRLAQLHASMMDLIDSHQPDLCVVEKAFCGVNASSALKLGESRGALIAAIFNKSKAYWELSPRQAKKCITGMGQASKEDVAASLARMFKLDLRGVPLDATDALAIAISGAMEHQADRGTYR